MDSEDFERYQLYSNSLGMVHPPPFIGEKSYFLPPSTYYCSDRKIDPIKPPIRIDDTQKDSDIKIQREQQENVYKEINSFMQFTVNNQYWRKCRTEKKEINLRIYQNTLFSTKTADEEQYRVLPDEIKRKWDFKDFKQSPEFIDWEPIIRTTKKVIRSLIKKSDRIIPKEDQTDQSLDSESEVEIRYWFHIHLHRLFPYFQNAINGLIEEKLNKILKPQELLVCKKLETNDNEAFLSELLKNARRRSSGQNKSMNEVNFIDRELLGPPRQDF